MSSPTRSSEEINAKARRAGIASFIGTTIEWYDFYIYGTAAALVFGDIFFSDTLPNGVGTLLAFITLWAGFLARPIGGIIFGHLGDRIGRKNTLVITLMMMGVATVGIGLLPTYAQVGIWAPIGLVTLRVIQGVAVGGEWGGAVLIASENAPKGKSILYSAFAQQGSPAGNLLATIAFFLLSSMPTPSFLLYGWRIPFIISAVLVILGMIIRLKLEESDEMKAVLARKKVVKLPLAEVLRKHWVLVLLGAGALPLAQVTYFKNTFALSWATKELGYDRGTFLAAIAIALVVQFIVPTFRCRPGLQDRHAKSHVPDGDTGVRPHARHVLRDPNRELHHRSRRDVSGHDPALDVLRRHRRRSRSGLPRQHPLHRSVDGVPIVFPCRRRRNSRTGAVDAQHVRQYRRGRDRIRAVRPCLADLHPAPAPTYRLQRGRTLDGRTSGLRRTRTRKHSCRYCELAEVRSG